MKRLIPLIIVYILICFTADCSAMDSGGCLTCHQYAGLVTQKRPGKFKIIHIDEERYLKSSHAAVDCRKCHVAVTKIPHTDMTAVNCNTGCHRNNEVIGAMDSYDTGESCVSGCHTVKTENVKQMERYLRNFHKDGQNAVTELRSGSSCRVCHPLYPHSRNNLVRAIINMHAGFITCEVCHLQNSTRGKFKICGNCHTSGRKLTYGWMGPEDIKFSAEPYGKYYRKKEQEEINIVSRAVKWINGLLGEFIFRDSRRVNYEATEYSVSRIAVFTENNGEKVPVISERDTSEALKYKSRERRLSARSKKRRLEYFHRDVAMVSISVACDECHISDSMLTRKELGLSQAEINRLKDLNVKGLVTHYDIFYFPKLLDISKQ